MKSFALDGQWNLYYFKEGAYPVQSLDDVKSHGLTPIPASVPGNVELDLVRAGKLEDPRIASHVRDLRPLELYEWWYETTFEAPDVSGKAELVFHGVDCLATYWLNDRLLGSSRNMLVEHRFDPGDLLRRGASNTLVVRLQSPVLHAHRQTYEPSMFAQNWEQLWNRKAAHSFGWDIMPRALSAGIWRSVELVIHEASEIRDIHIYTMEANDKQAKIGVFYQLDADPAYHPNLRIRIRGTCGTSSFEMTDRIKFSAGVAYVWIQKPQLWWPRGYGKAHLYDVVVQILFDDEVIAETVRYVGIRYAELLRTEITSDEHPGQFLFRVNGVPIFCKGSNWVPADMFHSRDAERIDAMLDLLIDANCNIVRCWGGNVYEDHAFFERCDRDGIMVWQDFSLANGSYPREELFHRELKDEARKIIRKLRNHPSLILWCGDNEIDYAFSGRELDPNTNVISRELLPAIVQECDPYRPYLQSSPYYSPEFWKTRNLRLLPEEHLWGPRDYYKSGYYRNGNQHFVSEIGYHGCPNLSSIRTFIDEEHLWPWQNNEQWAYHATEPAGLKGPNAQRIHLMTNQIHELFGIIPEEMPLFILASQVSQAEAKKFFIEMTRLKKWRNTGIIWWNMIDGWPQFSDAVVDYYFSKKLAYHYIKRVQADVCIMIDEPENWHVDVVVSNDTRATHEGTYRIRDADSDEILLSGTFSAAANENTKLGRIRVSHGDVRLFLIEWTIGNQSYGNHYVLGFPPLSLERYQAWLPKIAQLPSHFNAAGVGV